jgi:peptide deformylase
MALLPIIYAPHPIFKQVSAPLKHVDEAARILVANMFETLYAERALGLSAPMVGIAQRVAVVDLGEEGARQPITLINPEITWQSETQQAFSEASLSFPYISAEIQRPSAIELRYLDAQGESRTLRAEGFLATVIQHELDYFEGRTFLDHLSRTKREMLLKKMQKAMRLEPPHVHGPHCQH